TPCETSRTLLSPECWRRSGATGHGGALAPTETAANPSSQPPPPSHGDETVLRYATFVALLLAVASPAIAQTTAEERLEMYAEHERMSASSPFRNLPWQFIGP